MKKRCFLLVFLSILSFTSFSQEAGKVEEKVEVYLVSVPTIVLDKKGKFVEGLKRENFEVFEDGERQEITVFYLEKVSEGKLQIEGIEGKEKKGFEKIPGQRTIVIIFDQMISSPFHITRVKKPLEDFLRKFLRKEDKLLIFIGENSYFWWGKTLFATSLDQISNSIKESIKTPLQPSDFIHFENKEFIVRRGEADAPNIIFQFLSAEYEMMTSFSLRRLMRIAEELKKIEGEKTLVFLSEGYGSFNIPRSKYRDLQDPAYMAKIFNNSNVKVYSLDISGLQDYDFLYSQSMTASQREEHRRLVGPSMKQGYLRQLSHDTGGEAITNTNDMGEGLQMIGEMMSKTYILGYTPRNRKMDGKYRKIKVKVKRKDVEIRHRNGYFARDWKEEQYKDLEEFLRKGEKRKGGEKEIGINIESTSISSFSNQCLVFSIEPSNLGLASLIWEENGTEKRVFSSRFLILARLERDGKVFDEVKDEVYFVLKEGDFERKSFLYWAKELKAGRYKIKVGIEDKNRNLMQMEEKEIEVPPFNAEEGIERFFFVNESEFIRSLNGNNCLPEIKERRLYPRSSNRFSRGEMLSIFFEYLSKEKKGGVDVRINIYKGKDLVKSIKTNLTIGGERTPFYISIPLSEFPQGDYMLEVNLMEPERGFEIEKRANFKVYD